MTRPEPNPAQRDLIEGTEGTYLVDAGAGTGKTLAVTRRYATIVDQPGVDPEDVLLVTFTRSAATEMKERIVEHSAYGVGDLADAPIRTFHSHCHHLLREHGHAAPTHLGIDDRITGSTRIIEDELIEGDLFADFLGQFRDDHPEYADQFRALDEDRDLLDLITQLAAKGIVPTADGWYRDGESTLDGDLPAFEALLEAANEPRNGGRKHSELRADLGRYGGSKTYRPSAPEKSALRGQRGTKRVDSDLMMRAFAADREPLKRFVHDVYFEYLVFALGHNYLNFGFLQLFAAVLLREDPALRERLEFEYVMVDEFQDTSEIQFELTLLLAGTANLCVVGDWKQSIYGFQYADVENITDFEDRLEALQSELDPEARPGVDPGALNRIELTENYRSTQRLLDFSEDALTASATGGEDVPESVLEDVVSLSANAPFEDTTIEAIQHAEEHEAVLAKVQEIVGNDAYPVPDEDGEPRTPDYGDVAVLTRTRDYGRELLQVAGEYDLPVAYDGGVELFRTDPAKLLLAWLRILETDADRGWAPVLERAGYTQAAIAHCLETGEYPAELRAFRAELDGMGTVAAVARRVFDRYGLESETADVVLHRLQSVHDETTHTRGDLIRYVERAIESGLTHEVHTSAGDEAVTVRTIHAAKGLEYPIVVLANMNEGRFPPRTRDQSFVRYEEPLGLRRRKEYAEVHEYPHVFDNWRYDVLCHCLPQGYDEERRLLYVAITRAKHHLVFAAGEEPNAFLESLPVSIDPGHTEVDPVTDDATTQAQLPFTVRPPEGPRTITPHDLIDEGVFEGESEDRDTEVGGTDFGDALHGFAEAYALGETVSPANDDQEHVAAFLDDCSGETLVEEPARLPLQVDGQRVTISGVLDLVHVTEDTVEIVDYKTDRKRRDEEYRKQVSVYAHVLDAVYPERAVSASLFYTETGERVFLEPLSQEALADIVATTLAE